MPTKHSFVSLIFILLVLVISGCAGKKYFSKKIIEPVTVVKPTDEIQKEVDEIFSLLAYSIVYLDWQKGDIPREERRGYNIGTVLVDSENHPVFHGLNCINSTDNVTQHGEVRSIMGYLDKTRRFNLADFTLYTTLEPCVMCAGMITMSNIKRTVWGMHDVNFSKAFERLAIDTRPIGGYAPYPRQVEAMAVDSPFCRELDEAYAVFMRESDEKFLAKFLTSQEAEGIFRRAYNAFNTYRIKYPRNQSIYSEAVFYLKNLEG